MKKKYIKLLLLFVLLAFLDKNLKAAILDVPSGYSTIQLAINSAQAGDTVLVRPGNYYETPIVKANIFLIGSGYNSTFINGGGIGNSTGSVIQIDGNGCTIEGFTIENANLNYWNNLGAGIDGNSFGLTAINNRIRNCRIGIRLYNNLSDSSIVERNIIQDNLGLCGIIVSWAKAQIINNTVYNNARGIQYYYSTPNIINNIVTNNYEYGIVSFDSIVTTIRYNDVFNNGINYSFIPDQTGINGNIAMDPLFVNDTLRDFNLTINSPCIDSGDTLTPKDPDSTRVEIGALYFLHSNIGLQNKITTKELIMYPNPTKIKLIINLQQPSNLQNSTVYIYDLQGQMLMQHSIQQQQTELNISQFTKGIYIVKVYNEKETLVSKFIKE